jgi:hypothetical protein
MVGEKKQRNVIQFEANTAVPVVLDTDPAMAKQGQRTTKANKIQYFWTYFVQGGSIFFADRSLQEALQGHKKGDAVIVTNVVPPGNKWGAFKVEGSGTVHRATSGLDAKVDEALSLLRAIITHLNVKAAPQAIQTQTTPTTEKGADLDF